jgi:cupin fold WbuC family metalloprotein
MIKIIHNHELDELKSKAVQSERRRTHLNVHDTLDASVQRLFIATEPDTYMRPHRHPQAHKWEFLMVISGEIDLLVFADDGTLIQRENLSPSAVRVVEIPSNTWHAYVCQQPGTVVLEVKEGAYLPTEAGDFAPWSPAENTEGAEACLQWMRNARLGSKYL